MRNFFVIISIVFLISSCSEEMNYSTPAQSHIDEYTNKLKFCKTIESPTNPASSEKAATIDSVATSPINSQHTQTDQQQPVAPSENEQHKSSESVPIEAVKMETDFGVHSNDITFGDIERAKVVMIEYFSPTCPHCAYYHKTIFPEIKKNYIDTGKIIYVIREFISNKQDLDASVLARCAANKNSFLKFTEVLLEQQDNWAWSNKYRELLTNIGQLGGISAESYAKCLGDEKIADLLVTNSKIAARSTKFVGTPSFFINGAQYTNSYTLKGLSDALELAIKESNPKSNE